MTLAEANGTMPAMKTLTSVAAVLTLLTSVGVALAGSLPNAQDILNQQSAGTGDSATSSGTGTTSAQTPSIPNTSGCQIDSLMLQTWKARVAAEAASAAPAAKEAKPSAQGGKPTGKDRTEKDAPQQAPSTKPPPLFRAEDVDLQFLPDDKGARILRPRSTFVLTMKLGSEIAGCIGDGAGPTLFVDHLAFRWLLPMDRYIDKDLVRVTYRIDPLATPQQSWNETLLRSWTHENPRLVTIGIGGSGSEVVIAKEKVSLSVGYGGPWLGCVALVLALAILAAFGLIGNGLLDRRSQTPSYSLSRFVLACWVLTTTAAIVLMLVHTEVLPSVADGGLAFMVAASGLGMGISSLIDVLRKADIPQTPSKVSIFADFFKDADGVALHRVQAGLLNALVLGVVWWELIQYGSVAMIDKSWAALVGASTITYLMGKRGEAN